jgi:hypothetical protein
MCQPALKTQRPLTSNCPPLETGGTGGNASAIPQPGNPGPSRMPGNLARAYMRRTIHQMDRILGQVFEDFTVLIPATLALPHAAGIP